MPIAAIRHRMRLPRSSGGRMRGAVAYARAPSRPDPQELGHPSGRQGGRQSSLEGSGGEERGDRPSISIGLVPIGDGDLIDPVSNSDPSQLSIRSSARQCAQAPSGWQLRMRPAAESDHRRDGGPLRARTRRRRSKPDQPDAGSTPNPCCAYDNVHRQGTRYIALMIDRKVELPAPSRI